MGFTRFFYILEAFMVVFGILTIFAIGNMALYAIHGDSNMSENIFDFVEIGNLGYATPY
jgi:hypothetical protein